MVKNLSLGKENLFLKTKCMDLEMRNKGLLSRNTELLRERAHSEEDGGSQREASSKNSKLVKPKVGVKAAILKKKRESLKEKENLWSNDCLVTDTTGASVLPEDSTGAKPNPSQELIVIPNDDGPTKNDELLIEFSNPNFKPGLKKKVVKKISTVAKAKENSIKDFCDVAIRDLLDLLLGIGVNNLRPGAGGDLGTSSAREIQFLMADKELQSEGSADDVDAMLGDNSLPGAKTETNGEIITEKVGDLPLVENHGQEVTAQALDGKSFNHFFNSKHYNSFLSLVIEILPKFEKKKEVILENDALLKDMLEISLHLLNNPQNMAYSHIQRMMPELPPPLPITFTPKTKFWKSITAKLPKPSPDPKPKAPHTSFKPILLQPECNAVLSEIVQNIAHLSKMTIEDLQKKLDDEIIIGDPTDWPRALELKKALQTKTKVMGRLTCVLKIFILCNLWLRKLSDLGPDEVACNEGEIRDVVDGVRWEKMRLMEDEVRRYEREMGGV